MGGLFGGGPTDGDIERLEEKTRLAELARIRKAEIKLRRRESKETMEGGGLSLATNIDIGSDREAADIDFSAQSREQTVNESIEKPQFRKDLLANFNFGSIRLS